jgi:hypothetical protein
MWSEHVGVMYEADGNNFKIIQSGSNSVPKILSAGSWKQPDLNHLNDIGLGNYKGYFTLPGY